MIPLLLGLATLVALMAALGAFSRAQVATIKAFAIWLAAIGGLVLAALLFLTGRGSLAIGALVMLGPSVWAWLRPGAAGGRRTTGPGSQGQGSQGQRTQGQGAPRGARGPAGGMSRDEALQVLGLPPRASPAEIQAAYLRLMRTAHPDGGGSDWLAARINQARDTLLG